MILLMILLYGVPMYLIFFKYKLIPLTKFWKFFLWVPPARYAAGYPTRGIQAGSCLSGW